MNALTKLQAEAGQKIHEARYEAEFYWGQSKYPCTHGEIGVNPMLALGGLSPDTEVTIMVRNDLFTTAARPSKLDPCVLKVASGREFRLKVDDAPSGAGDFLQKFVCVDINQGA